MKIEEALKIIDEALATIQANRQTHVVLQQAIEVIKEAITPKDK